MLFRDQCVLHVNSSCPLWLQSTKCSDATLAFIRRFTASSSRVPALLDFSLPQANQPIY
jgi:hypothetical protein